MSSVSVDETRTCITLMKTAHSEETASLSEYLYRKLMQRDLVLINALLFSQITKWIRLGLGLNTDTQG